MIVQRGLRGNGHDNRDDELSDLAVSLRYEVYEPRGRKNHAQHHFAGKVRRDAVLQDRDELRRLASVVQQMSMNADGEKPLGRGC